MKVRITVQMHLEGVENYYYSDIESYNEFLNDRLYSYAEIESMTGTENHAGPEFKITLRGSSLSYIVNDIVRLTGSQFDRSLLNEIEELSDQYESFDDLLKSLSIQSQNLLLKHFDDVEVEIIY